MKVAETGLPVQNIKYIISTIALFCTGFSALGDDRLVAEVSIQVKRTLKKIDVNFRPPLRVRSAATVFSVAPGANTTPYGYEFDSDGASQRLIQTSALTSSANSQSKPELTKNRTENAEAVVAGVHSRTASVMGRTPTYTFTLERGQATKGWLLTLIGKNGESNVDGIDQMLTQRLDEASHPANTLNVLDGSHRLDTLFETDGFKLTGSSQEMPAGPVTINFTRSFRGLSDAVIECSYVFDPASRWLPVRWMEKVSAPQRDQSLTYSRQLTITDKKYESANTSIHGMERPEKGTITRKSLYTVEAVDYIPEAEFTLAAFGLPEPSGFEPPPTPLYVWLLGIAAVCFALTVSFRLLARHRRATAQPGHTPR